MIIGNHTSLPRGYVVSFIGVLFLGLLARGQAIFAPLYSIDSYDTAYRGEPDAIYGFLLTQGRYGLAALWWLRDAIGFYGIEVASATLIISIILFAASGFLFSIAVLKRPTAAETFILSALFTLHPYSTEFFHFSDATFNIALAIFLGALGIVLALRKSGLGGAAVSCLLIFLSISIYQLALVHIGAVWLLYAAYVLLKDRSDAIEYKENLSNGLRSLVLISLSLATYLVSLPLLTRLIGVRFDARTDLSKLINVQEKLQALRDAFAHTLWPKIEVIAPVTSALLLGLLVLCSGLVIWRVLRRGDFAIGVFLSVILIAALTWSLGASVLGGVIWLVPRVLSPFSVFVAGLTVIAWHGARLPAKGIIGGGICVLLISYVGASNQILFDQRRVNLWDTQQANRILAALERQPEFRRISSLAIVGGSWARSSRLRTTWGDMNISAFAASWAKLGIIEQATGYRFVQPSPKEMDSAQSYCATANVWPDAGAIKVVDTLGIVCLTKPAS
ncbi:glucosyltransferase domain-containing protein [Microvirga zambiensis]|uniref:glucosyltransferase domain-containing protein n=1 Tax=Microvirga zambiensis TaxID=1402137 RepID=UPI00191FCC87|nr:glucosyltransferase domain-containing protein [Microvirga zambiensis]